MAMEDTLYSELKPDIQALCTSLFEVSESLVRKQGTFLPHGAILTRGDEVKMVAAAPDGPGNLRTPAETLPLLHEGLRHLVAEHSAKALAVAESVTVALGGGAPTKAIKVLIEHERGLCTAMYLPWRRTLLRGIEIGSPTAIAAESEVNAWDRF